MALEAIEITGTRPVMTWRSIEQASDCSTPGDFLYTACHPAGTMRRLP
jgi:hypothetical protein